MNDQPRNVTEHSDTAAKETSDPGEVRARYQAWLGDDARVVGFVAPQSTGFSSLTYLADVERDGLVTREVLRSTPSGPSVFRSYDLGLQVACMRNLADVVPTPTILAWEPDPAALGAPFYVMEAVEGRIPDDNPPYPLVGWLKDEPADVQRAHYEQGLDVLAALHQVTPGDVALGDVLDHKAFGVTGLDQQIGWWRDLYDWGREATDQPTLDAAWQWLDDNRPADPGRDVVLWGDARISNMIFSPAGDVRAVIDWEMAGQGPAEVDVAWFLWMDRQFTEVFGAPRLEGFPGEDALIQRWSAAVGHAPRDLDWYLVFAGVRFSTTLMRVAIRTIASGAIPADADVYRNHLGTRLVAQTLGLPEPGPIGLMG